MVCPRRGRSQQVAQRRGRQVKQKPWGGPRGDVGEGRASGARTPWGRACAPAAGVAWLRTTSVQVIARARPPARTTRRRVAARRPCRAQAFQAAQSPRADGRRSSSGPSRPGAVPWRRNALPARPRYAHRAARRGSVGRRYEKPRPLAQARQVQRLRAARWRSPSRASTSSSRSRGAEPRRRISATPRAGAVVSARLRRV